MPAHATETGTLTIDGTLYTWTELTFPDLEEFETQVGTIFAAENAPSPLDTLRGRQYIAFLALRKCHPDLTLGDIRNWRPTMHVLSALGILVVAAVPFLDTVDDSESPPASDSPDSSSSTSLTPTDGPPAQPDSSD